MLVSGYCGLVGIHLFMQVLSLVVLRAVVFRVFGIFVAVPALVPQTLLVAFRNLSVFLTLALKNMAE